VESLAAEKNMHIGAVIFDLDGTLAKFNLDYKTVRMLVKTSLVKKGVPESLLSANESVFEMLKKTENWAASVGKSTTFPDDARSEALAITERHELEAASETSLLPGVTETLKALKSMGLKIGLCTINSEKSASHILERFGLSALFDVKITRDQVEHVKPHPEHIKKALKVLGIVPQEIVVVGDSVIDMKSARALHAIAVGLPTGISTLEQLEGSGANYIITRMIDLLTLIIRINTNSKSAKGKE
jgi:HAD superfamily hydrolase (TIGR01509 family)